MTDPVRPPFILVYAADQQGCGFHRCVMPLASLCSSGITEGRIDLTCWPPEMIQAVQPATIVFQRYVEDAQIAAIEAVRKAVPDALLIYELDDYLGEIPPASFHAGFMPPNLPERIAKAVALCDRVTVSTETLAEWFRSDEIGAKDVRVVGNAIPQIALRPREGRPAGQRLRIGFVGGLSHDGDFEIIRPAMADIGDAVEWVFFGSEPKNSPVRTEFHPGVQAHEYQTHMLKLDLDLMLAPIEDNRFNRCKSNLRLIDTGMIGACVIAQRLGPYTEGAPPVFAYADTPEEWTAAIRTFIATPQSERTESAAALQDWVRRNHTLEVRLPTRLDAWVKRDPVERTFAPAAVRKRIDDVVLALPEIAEAPTWAKYMPRRFTLLNACDRALSTGSDILWMRAGTTMGEDAWRSMRGIMGTGMEPVMPEVNSWMFNGIAQRPNGVACAMPLASDGANSFPHDGRFTLIGPEMATRMSSMLAESLAGRQLVVTAPSGPVMLLSARALADIGFPDVVGCDSNEEQAIFEWGLRAGMRGWRTMQAADAYAACVMPPAPPSQRVSQRLQLRGYAQAFQQNGLGEQLTPRERIETEMKFLRAQWAGPVVGTMGFGSDYMTWSIMRGELPVVDTTGVSVAVTTFGAEPVDGEADSEWLIFTDDTVQWRENGMPTLAAALKDLPPTVLVVYADHEFVSPDGSRTPDLAPDFDLELFLARDYVTQACAVRREALSKRPVSRGALYAEVLDIATEFGSSAFRHVPKFVAAQRDLVPEESAVYALDRQMAIEAHFGDAVEVTAHRMLLGVLAVTRRWQPKFTSREGLDGIETINAPLISVIVPTLGAGRLIQPCVNTIRQHTRYPNFEIIVVQNGPRAEPELGAALKDPRVRVVRWEPTGDEGFNWSRLSNEVVREHARGDYLCFVNDDVATGTEMWLDRMMGQAVQRDVGAVGARLVHPAGVVQHVGVIVHHGIAGHLHKGLPNGNPGNGWLALVTHEMSAVTGACMLVSRRNFDAVGGFDVDKFPMNYGDIDFCMKLRKCGLRNVVEMTAELLHPEGTSRTDPNDHAKFVSRLLKDNARFAARWPDPDPYWHPDLALGLAQGGIAIPGLNRDQLQMVTPVVTPEMPRVLLVNDFPGMNGQAVQRVRAGQVCMAADISGLALRLIAPVPANVQSWDVRAPDVIAGDLKLLGVSQIILRSDVGADGSRVPVEALRCMTKLGIEWSAEPRDPAAADWAREFMTPVRAEAAE